MTTLNLKKYIKETINQTLNEGFDDIAHLGIKLRIKLGRPQDPSVKDILTGIRGIEHVITIRQTGILTRPEGSKRYMYIIMGYEKHPNYSLVRLATQIKNINGVDMVRVLSYDGKKHLIDGKPIIV